MRHVKQSSEDEEEDEDEDEDEELLQRCAIGLESWVRVSGYVAYACNGYRDGMMGCALM